MPDEPTLLEPMLMAPVAAVAAPPLPAFGRAAAALVLTLMVGAAGSAGAGAFMLTASSAQARTAGPVAAAAVPAPLQAPASPPREAVLLDPAFAAGADAGAAPR